MLLKSFFLLVFIISLDVAFYKRIKLFPHAHIAVSKNYPTQRDA